MTASRIGSGSPAVSLLLLLVGGVLLAHAAMTAYLMKDKLKAHHHAASPSLPDVQAASLPIFAVLEALAGYALCLIGWVLRKPLMSILRKDAAMQEGWRYDHSVYTGIEFASLNHRGRH